MSRVPPFVKVFLLTICGVLIADNVDLPSYTLLIIILLLIVVIALSLRTNRVMASVCSASALILFGIFLSATNRPQVNHFANFNLQSPKYKAVIVSKPSQKNKSTSFEIQIVNISNDSISVSTTGKAIAYIPPSSPIPLITDTICFHSVPQPLSANLFPTYKSYLLNRNITHTVFIADRFNIINSHRFSLLKTFAHIDQYIIRTLNINSSYSQEAEIARALLTGDKQGIDPSLRNSYSQLGIAHILTVSGLHVGIIFLIFSAAFSFLRYGRLQLVIKAFIILLVIWFYAGLAGFSPSVQRAAVMFSVFTIASVFRQEYSSLNALAISGFITIVISPASINDIGFQMSYIAVASIIIVANYLNKKIQINSKPLQYLVNTAILTLSAQIALMPLIAYYFHQVSLVFLFTNIIIIPILSFIILPLLIIGISTSFTFVLQTAYYILKLVNIAVSHISSLPHTSIDNVHISLPQTIIIYLILIITALIIHKLRPLQNA